MLAYAVLPNDMPSAFAVVFQGAAYRLVSLRELAGLEAQRSYSFGARGNGVDHLGAG